MMRSDGFAIIVTKCYDGVTNRSAQKRKKKHMKNKIQSWLKVAVWLLLFAFVAVLPASAQSDVTDITDAASSVFATVATVCVTIGVFMIGYRLARKIR